MDDWLFTLQLGLVALVVALIGGWTVSYAVRASRAGAPPSIKASFRELQQGWYQVQIAVANRAPYSVIVDELRRVSPRGARLLAPIKQVSTRTGEFQVWSHPSTDKATTSIPLDLRLGPHESHSGTVARAAKCQVTAWLFLSGNGNPGEVILELALLDGAGHLRRYPFTVRHEHAPTTRTGNR